MVRLRVVLVQSVLGAFTDPGGFFWGEQVDGWLERRTTIPPGTPYRSIANPRLVKFPARAAVYLSALDSVNAGNLHLLAANFADVSPWVNIERVTIVGSVASEDDDIKALEVKTLPGAIGAIGDSVGDGAKWTADAIRTIATVLAVGVAVAAVVYAARKSGGTKSWL